MNKINILNKFNFLVVIFALFMLIILISCEGGGGGGGIIPPIGGGNNGGNNGNPNISFNNEGYLIIETKTNSLNTSTLSFNFQTINPNILANQTTKPLRNTSNNIKEYKCGFIPSDKKGNLNIYYSYTAPTIGDIKNFGVFDFSINNNVIVNAKCVYVNNNPKYAIWVDTNNNDNFNEEQLFNINQTNIITHFNNDYNTLTANIGALNFYVDILITEKIDSSTNPSVIGYFWGIRDPQRVNVHPFSFSLIYNNYNEFNVTLAHEFVHLLEFNKAPRGNNEAWIAEGLATYGEYLCGYLGDVRINSIKEFFNFPDTTPLITNFPDFPNYGKSFLFIKQLDQRFTNAWANMVTSNLYGINLIEHINGQEDFQTTVDKFNTAVLIDTNDNNPTYDFININLNSATFNNGIYRYNGWNNTTLNNTGAVNSMTPWSSYYLYKNSTFNGNILVNNIQLLFNNFDSIPNSWNMKYVDFSNDNNIRFIVIYR